ncbi:helix-turn-helix domain-containing protein [Embleya sp. NPDC055664]
MALLRELREWSALTYRQLAAKAEASGRVLPASTVAAALGRTTLPRADLVEALVTACGLGPEATARWLKVRDDLAAGRIAERPDDAEPPAPADPPIAPKPARRRWRLWAIAAVTTGVVTAGAIVVAIRAGSDDDHHGRLPNGQYLIKPGQIRDGSLCLGEGRERNGRTDRPIAAQIPCANLVPDTYLTSLNRDVYQIEWHHPVEGVGCLRVDESMLTPGALLSPGPCTRAANERFLIEPAQPAEPGVYRISPVHSGLCVGILGGPAETTVKAEAEQAACSGGADQRFRLERVR